MRIHYLQHVPYESPASIVDWAAEQGHNLTGHHLYRGDAAPMPVAGDALVVMGGPMSIHDEHEHAWLAPEKRALRAWIDAGKPVLGICLGSQLIAEALGGEVARNRHQEIGWHPIRRSAQAAATTLADLLPAALEVFHWHGETFSLPEGAVLLASSDACENQGFLYRRSVLALQCHLEMDDATARGLIEASGHVAAAPPYVQSAAEMLARPERFAAMRRVLFPLLDRWAAGIEPVPRHA